MSGGLNYDHLEADEMAELAEDESAHAGVEEENNNNDGQEEDEVVFEDDVQQDEPQEEAPAPENNATRSGRVPIQREPLNIATTTGQSYTSLSSTRLLNTICRVKMLAKCSSMVKRKMLMLLPA